MKQLMAGGGVALIGTILVPLLIGCLTETGGRRPQRSMRSCAPST